MIGRRGVLIGVMAMTVPGAGGQQSRPFNAPAGQATPIGVQAGVTGGVEFARVVVVYGPTGAVNGVFIYSPGTKPAAGNGPVLSGTYATKDLYGNTVVQGWVSYGSGGDYGALNQGSLSLVAGTGQLAAGGVSTLGKGGVQLNSGEAASGDTPAQVSVESAQNAGGSSTIVLGAQKVELVNGASALIPLAHLSQFPISGAATLATTIAAVNALYAALVTTQVFAS